MDVKIEETPQKNRYGDYIKHLVIDGYIWMSNTDQEMVEMYEDTKSAKGDCWIGGLGLGLMPEILANKISVRSVTVVEINKEVIDLVAPRIEKQFPGKVRIWQGDALSEQAFLNTQYDWMYLDTYIEGTERAYKEEVLVWLANTENFLQEGGHTGWWLKDKMLNDQFSSFEFEK